MKISEFLQDFFTTTGPTGNPNIPNSYELDSKALQIPELQQQLLKCDEFKNTNNLVILDVPERPLLEGGTTITVPVLLGEDYKFAETVYLYAISLTPPIYDPEVVNKSVKDGIVISPTLYNIETFIPYKSLKIEWCPEHSLDRSITDADFQAEFLERIKEALDNPKEYTPISERRIFIRCTPDSFEKIEETTLETKQQIVRLR